MAKAPVIQFSSLFWHQSFGPVTRLSDFGAPVLVPATHSLHCRMSWRCCHCVLVLLMEIFFHSFIQAPFKPQIRFQHPAASPTTQRGAEYLLSLSEPANCPFSCIAPLCALDTEESMARCQISVGCHLARPCPRTTFQWKLRVAVAFPPDPFKNFSLSQACLFWLFQSFLSL